MQGGRASPLKKFRFLSAAPRLGLGLILEVGVGAPVASRVLSTTSLQGGAAECKEQYRNCRYGWEVAGKSPVSAGKRLYARVVPESCRLLTLHWIHVFKALNKRQGL